MDNTYLYFIENNYKFICKYLKELYKLFEIFNFIFNYSTLQCKT